VIEFDRNARRLPETSSWPCRRFDVEGGSEVLKAEFQQVLIPLEAYSASGRGRAGGLPGGDGSLATGPEERFSWPAPFGRIALAGCDEAGKQRRVLLYQHAQRRR
jgi:hypothetical protein